MLQPQNPWETGELAGLMGVARDEGEVVSTWSVGVGFDHQMAPVLRGRVCMQHTYKQARHVTSALTTYVCVRVRLCPGRATTLS
jgi:hypothetical protein